MAILEKRVLLGVQQTKKSPNKSKKKIAKKKPLFEKFVDYLKSDSYLYSRLSRPSKFSSLKGVQVIKRDKEISKKSLVKIFGDYLMSDSYLYSPLLDVPSKSFYISPKEAQVHIKRVTTASEIPRKRLSVSSKDNKLSANGLSYDVPSNKINAIKDIQNMYSKGKPLSKHSISPTREFLTLRKGS